MNDYFLNFTRRCEKETTNDDYLSSDCNFIEADSNNLKPLSAKTNNHLPGEIDDELNIFF